VRSRDVMVPYLICGLLLAASGDAGAEGWPRFRGPAARGTLDGQKLPESWDVASGTNVRWRISIPGIGHSSPIVWGNRVFVTTAVSGQDEELVLGDEGGIDLADDSDEFSWRIYCLDSKSGEILWQREAYAGVPRATRHVKSSQANSTPASDGRVVVAVFGSQGLKAFDLAGKELWQRDLGVLDPGLFGDATSHWGYASSPVIHDGLVFIQVDRHAASYLAAFHAATGEEVWKIERDEKPVWSTPTVYEGPGRTQLIVMGGDWDRGLDPKTGRELWRFARDYEVKVSSPIVAEGLIILSGGYRATPLQAVPVGAAGVVETPAWTSPPGGPYTPTPLAYRDRIFFPRNNGVLTVLSVESGEVLHRSRLGGNFSASPVASDGRVYLASEEGIVTVVTAEAEPEVLARIDMAEPIMASPAISEGTLFVRTAGHLYALGQ
jgi:outer membrane protein assembly factor BamB